MPIILAVIVPFIIVYYIRRLWLLLQVRLYWIPKQKYVLFVYSDNPTWKKYAETKILSRIKPNTTALNWSEKQQWIENTKLLEVRLFRHFMWGVEWVWKNRIRTGGQDFNHLAIVFIPWYKPKKIKFWKAWKDYEFGKKEGLEKMRQKLFDLLQEEK
ncbi:hypothetical protein HY637_02385 [Candidatus Woesearchaeota archaeon]|nr:hypothetical protein [Candidatus Woesearchaeota archaeon]